MRDWHFFRHWELLPMSLRLLSISYYIFSIWNTDPVQDLLHFFSQNVCVHVHACMYMCVREYVCLYACVWVYVCLCVCMCDMFSGAKEARGGHQIPWCCSDRQLQTPWHWCWELNLHRLKELWTSVTTDPSLQLSATFIPNSFVEVVQKDFK